MRPEHLEQVNRAAAAPSRWLLAATRLLAQTEQPAPPPSALFESTSVKCPLCGRSMARDALKDHTPLCEQRECTSTLSDNGACTSNGVGGVSAHDLTCPQPRPGTGLYCA